MKYEQVVHVAFYFSDEYASEYLAAFEQHMLLRKHFSVYLVSANLDNNVFNIVPRSSLKVISSFITKQELLYRWTDVIPQIVWHFKVYQFLKSLHTKQKVCISGVMPWIPIFLYSRLRHDVVFLGVGGSTRMIDRSSKERVRLLMSKSFLNLFAYTKNNIKVVPRTTEASDLWKRYSTNVTRVIPERVNPINRSVHVVNKKDQIEMLWIGQDVPRKRLDLGLYWFSQLKMELSTELHIYGTEGNSKLEGVNFHGWVSAIDYKNHSTKLVLLLSSDREGLPSAAIEVLQLGGIVITRNIGSISALQSDRVIVISDMENDWKDIALTIRNRFSAEVINVVSEDFSNLYMEIL